MSLLGGFGWAVRVLSGDSPSRVGDWRYSAGMEKRGVLRVGSIALAAVGVLAVTSGASAQVDAAQVGRYGTVESAQALLPATAASEYVLTIRALISSRAHAEQSDADLVQAGKSLCAEIADGATWDTFSAQIAALPGSANASDFAFYRTVIRSAVFAFCPADAGVLR